MRHFLILMVVFSSFLFQTNETMAQNLDTAQATITLKARHHAYLIAFMGDRGDADRIRYINQVVNQLTDTANREQDITVNVSQALIEQLFVEIGSQPERLTTVYNAEIKAALLPQLQNYPGLLAAISTIAQKNSAETEQMVTYGFAFIHAVKQ